jgi:ribosomal protein S27AE
MEGIMATAFKEKTKIEQLGNQMSSSAVHNEWKCTRCGGLMVNDSYLDLLNNVGESKFSAKRCVQCGEVVDPVILRNRGTRQEPIIVTSATSLSI